MTVYLCFKDESFCAILYTGGNSNLNVGDDDVVNDDDVSVHKYSYDLNADT